MHLALSFLLLQWAHQRAYALSSASPPDLWAAPAFEIALTADLLANDTAADLLNTPSDDGTRYELMRTASGQAFLCSIPFVSKSSAFNALPNSIPASSNPISSDKGVGPKNEQEQEAMEAKVGLERGLQLLEPLKGGCLYQKYGWFTYAFCHGSEIRQFHEIRVAGSNVPAEDPNNDVYILGFYPTEALEQQQIPAASAQVVSSTSSAGLSEVLSTDERHERLPNYNSRRYLSQTWTGGTPCEVNYGQERKIEVQFHCNTQTTDRIALIRETAICEYIMVIQTPRLCGEQYFLGSDMGNEATAPNHAINCRPIAKTSTLDAGAPKGPTDPIPEESETSSAASPQPEAEAQDEPAPPNPDAEGALFYMDVDTGEIISADQLAEGQAAPRKQGGPLTDFRRKNGDAFKGLSAILEGLAKSLPAKHGPRQHAQLPQQGEVGNSRHQAMKGLYQQRFTEPEEEEEEDTGNGRPRDEL